MSTSHRIAAGLVSLLLSTSIGACATHASSPQPSVGIGTALTVERTDPTYSRLCSSDCGVADEPTNTGIVQCGWATDDLAESVVLSTDVVLACDYRVTHEPCEEDEVCAVQQVNDTGGFGR